MLQHQVARAWPRPPHPKVVAVVRREEEERVVEAPGRGEELGDVAHNVVDGEERADALRVDRVDAPGHRVRERRELRDDPVLAGARRIEGRGARCASVYGRVGVPRRRRRGHVRGVRGDVGEERRVSLQQQQQQPVFRVAL